MHKKIVLAFFAVLAASMLGGCATAQGSVAASQADASSPTASAGRADAAQTASAAPAGSAGQGVAEVGIDYVEAHASSSKLLDIRDFTDYAGKLDDEADRGGHVPGAINIPYANMLDRKTGEPVSDTRLSRMFTHAYLEPADDIVVYGEGTEDALAVAGLLARCGYGKVSVWAAGYGEWEQSDNEVEKSSLSCCGV
ncbi:MAG: hypothetical protein IJ131_06715 [Eggerthellaceae bacterium]|nr:hypothetical protein [Eggerthellaceae bacterium]